MDNILCIVGVISLTIAVIMSLKEATAKEEDIDEYKKKPSVYVDTFKVFAGACIIAVVAFLLFALLMWFEFNR